MSVQSWSLFPYQKHFIDKALKLPWRFFKVIPQKLNLPMNFFETFPESSLLSTVSIKAIKMIGHYSRLRDMIGQSCPIYAYVHYLSVHVTFCGSSKHTLLK